MKVLGIAGSPRRGGNTDLLLEQAMEGAKSAGAETETIVLCQLNIAPCRHCDGCLKEGKCVIDDDMQSIYPKLREADRIILASPMFFMGITAQAKAMIDRCQALWALKYVLKQPVALNTGGERKGLFIALGGTGFSSQFDASRPVIKSWLTTIDAFLVDELHYSNLDAKGAVKDHPTALKDAFEAGRKLVEE
ncbi:MAG: flavodoxin family protein [Dehalococcoidia bacterium]